MTPSAPPPWQWPALRARRLLAVLAAGLALGLVQGLAVGFSLRAEGQQIPWSRPLFWEITGCLSAFALMPLPLTAVLNAPWARVGWRRFAGLHLGAYLTYTGLHIALMMASRYPIYHWLGWGSYHYGNLAFRIPMEMAKDVLGYLLFAVGCSVYGLWRENQARALLEANLKAQLKEAQLQALTGNLDPHFLFNALNTISAVMYEDLGRTDTLLSDLGLLLRASFQGGAAWTLAEERSHTERYAALLLARFGDRFQLAWQLEPGLDRLPVPRFALQLLVENAVKHNGDLDHPLRVCIAGSRLGHGLRLRVEDNGVGFGPAPGTGTGTTTLGQGLPLLFGSAGQLERGNLAQGGAWVEVRTGTEVAR